MVSTDNSALSVFIDIDGSDATLGHVDPQKGPIFQDIKKYSASEVPTATECVLRYAKDAGISLTGADCAIIVSGVVSGDLIKIARCPWIISIASFRSLFQTTPYVLNDTGAMLWAATHVSPITHKALGAYGLPDFGKGGKWLAINYSGGLGAATLLSDDASGFVHVESESGHCTFAPQDSHEQTLMRNLEQIKKPVSWERALLAEAADGLWKDTPYEINRRDVIRKRAEMLGAFVGEMILASGTWDGVFLFKNAANLAANAEHSALFLRRMEARANFSMDLRKVPVWTVSNANINLVGAKIYVEARKAKRKHMAT